MLNIAEPLPRDRGNYTCKAINSKGEIASEPAKLDIQGRIVINKTYALYFNDLQVFCSILQYSVQLNLLTTNLTLKEVAICINITIITHVIMLL